MDLLFIGVVFLLMGVSSPTILSLGVLGLSLLLGLSVLMKFSSWFCFILFLLYIGGMMVIIMYFSTLIPNQRFNLKWYSLLMGGSVCTMLSGLMEETEVFCVGLSGIESLALYESGNMYISLSLLIFLFVLMVGVVVVTSFFGAPLRPLS